LLALGEAAARNNKSNSQFHTSFFLINDFLQRLPLNASQRMWKFLHFLNLLPTFQCVWDVHNFTDDLKITGSTNETSYVILMCRFYMSYQTAGNACKYRGFSCYSPRNKKKQLKMY